MIYVNFIFIIVNGVNRVIYFRRKELIESFRHTKTCTFVCILLRNDQKAQLQMQSQERFRFFLNW